MERLGLRDPQDPLATREQLAALEQPETGDFMAILEQVVRLEHLAVPVELVSEVSEVCLDRLQQAQKEGLQVSRDLLEKRAPLDFQEKQVRPLCGFFEFSLTVIIQFLVYTMADFERGRSGATTLPPERIVSGSIYGIEYHKECKRISRQPDLLGAYNAPSEPYLAQSILCQSVRYFRRYGDLIFAELT